MDRRPLKSALGALVVVVTLAVLTAGCTDDPGPGPSVTDPRTGTAEPGEELTPDPQRAADRAAIQAYKNYIDAYNQAGHDGYTAEGYDNVIWYAATDDFATELFDEVEPRAAAYAHQTGELKVSDFKVVEHKENSDIVLEVCEDSSNLDVVLPDGSSMLQPGTTGRFVATVEMTQLYTDPTNVELWRVRAASTDRGRPC